MKHILFASLFLAMVFMLMPQDSISQWLKDPSDEPKEDHIEDAMKWFYGRRTFGLGYIPQDAWINAVKQKEALHTKYYSNGKSDLVQSPVTTPTNINWTLVGPVNIQQGAMPHAGRVNTIVTDPTNDKIAYLGAANGGIWKTTNAGVSWKPTSDNAYSLAMGALAIDPSNPNILYAGTGEYWKADNYFGAGMLKTTDGGKTWNPSGLGNVGAFSKVIVNSRNTSIIYAGGAGSGGGLYISTDAGSTWNKNQGSLPPGDLTDISYVQSGSNDILYVALPAHGIFLSQDGGNNWNLVNNFPLNNGTAGQMRRVHVAADPKNWKDVVGMSVNYVGSLEAIQRSTDGGNTWPDFTNNVTDIFAEPGNSSPAQGWYDAYLVRDPSNPDSYLAGGISVWQTQDGGNTWTDVGLAYKGGVHPDQHVGCFSKSGSDIYYTGCDGGIAVSSDRGSTYTINQDSLAITQSYGIAIDQTVSDVSYTANQDNGTLSGGRAGEWSEIAGGDGGTVAVDAANNNNVYYIIPGKMQVYPNSNGINTSDSVGWLVPLAQDEKNHIMYTGSRFLYFLKGTSSFWTERSKELAITGYISTIAPAGDGKTLLIGTTEGSIWSTTDNGVSFTNHPNAGLPGRDVTAIKVSPTDQKTFYATFSGFGASHVMKTTDLGTTWTNISSTLPDISCNGIIIDDQHPTNLYVGTDIGVFFSPDDGADWIPYGTGLPNTAISDIAYHKTDRVIRVGTHGRSMWEAPMATTTISGITTPTISNVWYIGEPAEIAWYGASSAVKVEISINGSSTWQVISNSASGNLLTIPSVLYAPTEDALVRVTDASSQVLQSQSFRIRVRPAGTTLSTFSEQPLYMYDLAYDKDDNTLWATNFSTATSNPDTKIYKIDPNTGVQTGSISVAGGGYFTGIKYDPLTKHLFAHQSRQDVNKSFIYEITTTGSVVHKWGSPCAYGTGIFVYGDSLFLADRNVTGGGNNVIYVVSKKDPTVQYYQIIPSRVAAFGPRCITMDPTTGTLLHTWTDFQGTDATATLYDSYVLRLNRDDGTELNSWFVQDGVNSGTNVRGIEYDPRSNGSSVWVTVLNDVGNSSKILKVTLVNGPSNGVAPSSVRSASFGMNYPNPCSEYSTFPYSLDKDGSVKLIVRDILGREVFSGISQYQSMGDHSQTLDLRSLPSGRYFCELYLNNIRLDTKALIKE
jgi:photosystem II stability/assembly factor-like uncharacterized protein